VFVHVFVALWVSYHDNSKLRKSIFAKLGLGEGSDHLQLIKFRPSCASGKGVVGGAKIFGSAYYSQRAVFASLRAPFYILFLVK